MRLVYASRMRLALFSTMGATNYCTRYLKPTGNLLLVTARRTRLVSLRVPEHGLTPPPIAYFYVNLE